MIDSGAKDHQIIAVAAGDSEFNAYREAPELSQDRLVMIRRSFQDYKQLEGKVVEVDAIEPVEKAYPVIESALQHYSQKRRGGFWGSFLCNVPRMDSNDVASFGSCKIDKIDRRALHDG